MLKLEWPLLVPKNDAAYADVERLAQATFDLTEYIVDISARHGLAPGLQPLPGPVALHLACHARAQNMGAKAAEMLKLLPQSDDVTVVERCSGHGGSWGVMQENFEVALKVGKPVARKAAETLRARRAKKPARLYRVRMSAGGGAYRAGHRAAWRCAAPARAWHPVEIFCAELRD